MTEQGFILPHGNYTELLSYKKSLIVYSGTVLFCDRIFQKRDRTVDQMVQAARSGKQNIIEGSMASGTSKETEIKLTNVARATLDELIETHVLAKLGKYHGKLYALNLDGFFDPFKALLDHYERTGMLEARDRALIVFADTPAELAKHLE